MSRAAWMFAAAATWVIVCVTQASPDAQTRHQPAASQHRVTLQTSDTCMACHNGLTTSAGEDVSIGIAWRASMMANSSRDPYWQASVRRETLDHPTRAAAIEDGCANCHMPMSRTAAHAAGRSTHVFRLLPTVRQSSTEHRLAADGVGCALCHQIGPERLGSAESFVGGFVIPRGEPRMFGPFAVDPGRSAIMRSATGATPAEGEHIRQSELCATCHTLYTEALGSNGEVIGSLPEQVPFLEWGHSAYRAEGSCQDCHMPAAPAAPMASVLGEPRERVGRHTFLGGNFLVLRMLNRNRAELAVEALPHELDAAANATVRQLQTETATVSIESAQIRDEQLQADIVVRNLTGHKLPTGYPSRRAWLHVIVRDSQRRVLFESGGMTQNGGISGNDNDDDGSRFEPHYTRIERGDQVQIYESILGDTDGNLTTGLLTATRYLKDNRLLPRGFDKATAAQEIAVIGAALGDDDFAGEGDRVRYVVDVSRSSGPFEVSVELRFQPIAFRWAENLRPYAAPEPQRFVSYFAAMAVSSAVAVAQDSRTVGNTSPATPR